MMKLRDSKYRRETHLTPHVWAGDSAPVRPSPWPSTDGVLLQLSACLRSSVWGFSTSGATLAFQNSTWEATESLPF